VIRPKFFIVIIHCAIVIVVAVFICTCFILCIVNLLFSYSATQPQVCNKTQCQCKSRRINLLYLTYMRNVLSRCLAVCSPVYISTSHTHDMQYESTFSKPRQRHPRFLAVQWSSTVTRARLDSRRAFAFQQKPYEPCESNETNYHTRSTISTVVFRPNISLGLFAVTWARNSRRSCIISSNIRRNQIATSMLFGSPLQSHSQLRNTTSFGHVDSDRPWLFLGEHSARQTNCQTLWEPGDFATSTRKRPANSAINWVLQGCKRSQWKPSKTWQATFREDLEVIKLTWRGTKRVASDQAWCRKLVAQCSNRTGETIRSIGSKVK